MILKYIGYFLARWDMAKYAASLHEEIAQLHNDYDAMKQVAVDTDKHCVNVEIELELFKARLHAMHRRAQRAEAGRIRDIDGLRALYERSHELARRSAEAFRVKYETAYEDLRKVYPKLHYAWLAFNTTGYADPKAANEVAALEAELRHRYTKITTPPPTESFSQGASDG